MTSLDFNGLIILGGVVVLLYFAYRVGAFVLKIAIGLLVFAGIAAGLARVWPYVAAYFI